MTKLLTQVVDKDDQPIGFLAWCPGCENYHHFDLRWTFDGNMEKPTFSPSMLSTWSHGPDHEPRRCHSFLRAGVWEFLSDCTHEHAGKKLPLTPCPSS